MCVVSVGVWHMQRGRKASASDEQTGDSTRTAKKAKKQEVCSVMLPVYSQTHTPHADSQSAVCASKAQATLGKVVLAPSQLAHLLC